MHVIGSQEHANRKSPNTSPSVAALETKQVKAHKSGQSLQVSDQVDGERLDAYKMPLLRCSFQINVKKAAGARGRRIAWVLSFVLVPQHSCVFNVSEVST